MTLSSRHVFVLVRTKFVAKSISRSKKRVRRGKHATRRASQQPSLHMTMMIGDETSCARGPRVQVLPTGCFYFEGVLDFCSRCTFPGGESRGHVDDSGSVRMPARRQCDGRWECLVKPANCYRFIGTHGVHVPERKKDHRGRSSVTVDVVTRLRETEWTISDYGNSRRSPFAILRYIDVCVPNEHRAMKNWKWN